MKILKFYKSLLWLSTVLLISIITSCQKKEAEENTDNIEFTEIGPKDKLLGENIWLTGKNLKKVTAVRLPGIENHITDFVSITNDKIVLLAPKTTTDGKVVLITPSGEISSKSNLDFSVTFTISNIPKEVEAGNTLTIRGEYLNWIKEVWFTDQIKVTDFISSSLNELVIKVPLGAQTGSLKLIGGGTKPMTYISKDPLIITGIGSKKDFVYAQGGKLYLNGNEWTPHGASLYPTGANSNFKDSGFKEYMKNIMALAVTDRFTTVRIVNFIDGVTTNPYDAKVWENIDYLISQAASHNLKVILDLSTFRNYLLKDKGKMPYNYSDWKEIIDFIGRKYKDNPTIWLYSLAGEAEGPRAGDPEYIPQRPTKEQLTTFYKEASNALNAIAPNQLISCGGLIFLDYDSGIDWQSIFSLPNIHLPAIHLYGDGMKAVTPTISTWCKGRNKPFFIEEFGKEKTSSDSDISNYFQEIYTITKSNEIVGACFWNYGPETHDYSFDINSVSTPKTIATIRSNSPMP